MTVVVAVKTGSAAILAADSKLTTRCFAGFDPEGKPRFIDQTYDHAVKLVADRSETAIAAFAGNGNIGEQNAVDFFGSSGNSGEG
jgi:hypothetical protein